MPGSVELSFMGWGEEQTDGMHSGGAVLHEEGVSQGVSQGYLVKPASV